MSNDHADSVLRRKAATGRDAYRAKAMSLAKALRLTVAKVADDTFDLAMSMIGFTQETSAGENVTDGLDENALMVLLDGPDRKMGAALLDPSLVGGLIQQQTMGTVQPPLEGAEDRAMTPTDAAICAPFIDNLLGRAADLPEMPQDRALLAGFRFGARTEDLRLMAMALEASEYEVLKLTFDIAGGRRQGEMTLILPNPDDDIIALPDPADEGTEVPRCKSLEPVVLGLHADLMVSLAKVEMPLVDAGRLNPGDVIELGIETLDQVDVQTTAGRVLAQGSLGQSSGVRAVQISHERSHGNTPQRREGDQPALEQVPFDQAPFAGAVLDGEAVDLDGAADVPPYELAEIPPMPELPDLPPLDEGTPPAEEMPAGDLPPLDLPDLSDLPELDGLPPLDLEAG